MLLHVVFCFSLDALCNYSCEFFQPLPLQEVLSDMQSSSLPTPSSVPLTTPLSQPTRQASSIMSEESHSSSTSSSLSPSSLITSQDSNGQVQLNNNSGGSGSIPHASQESVLSGPPSQTSK